MEPRPRFYLVGARTRPGRCRKHPHLAIPQPNFTRALGHAFSARCLVDLTASLGPPCWFAARPVKKVSRRESLALHSPHEKPWMVLPQLHSHCCDLALASG